MRNTVIFFLLTAFTLVLVFVNVFYGAVNIPFHEVLDALLVSGNDDIASYIIRENRIPQTATALLAGAALAVCGLMLQTAFRNPLAGPSILGISSGASLGVAIVMLFLGGTVSLAGTSVGGSMAIILGAVVGSLAITILLTVISLRVRNSLMLLIVGIMTGYLTSSIVTLLSSLTSAQNLQGYVMWGMGSFGTLSRTQLPLFAILTIVCMTFSITLAKPLNLLLLGDNYARNLGVSVAKVKTRLLVITGLLSAVVTAFCGPVAFIGLAMPHIARMLVRTDNHFVLMPATMLAGAIVALGCNILSVLPERTTIPLNALTPVVGVPVILYVIISQHRRA